jgi:type III secretion protein L
MIERKGKIIRAADAACWRSGKQILHGTRRRIRSMLSEAQEEALAEELRGYAEGLDKARTEQVSLMMEMIARRDAYLAAIETELVVVVVNAVRKIFADFDDTARARIVVEKALKLLRNQSQATVRVHPSEYEAVRSSVDMLIRGCPNLKTMTVENDSRIKPGGCALVCDIGVVETDLETQIRALEFSLSRSVSSAKG